MELQREARRREAATESMWSGAEQRREQERGHRGRGHGGRGHGGLEEGMSEGTEGWREQMEASGITEGAGGGCRRGGGESRAGWRNEKGSHTEASGLCRHSWAGDAEGGTLQPSWS